MRSDRAVTIIEHDGSGNPSAIVSPYGQRTTLTVDAHDYLASLVNPANESRLFTSICSSPRFLCAYVSLR
ncbi:MAG: hypothetical protein HYR72_26675 [Deltaproteobacteria bacterium]|nr:hypothetical protein [Deltaproteobacteria bacterium]MBI3390399.1 hypothetical protein [Deltaproteobacteria bacterium]